MQQNFTWRYKLLQSESPCLGDARDCKSTHWWKHPPKIQYTEVFNNKCSFEINISHMVHRTKQWNTDTVRKVEVRHHWLVKSLIKADRTVNGLWPIMVMHANIWWAINNTCILTRMWTCTYHSERWISMHSTYLYFVWNDEWVAYYIYVCYDTAMKTTKQDLKMSKEWSQILLGIRVLNVVHEIGTPARLASIWPVLLLVIHDNSPSSGDATSDLLRHDAHQQLKKRNVFGLYLISTCIT